MAADFPARPPRMRMSTYQQRISDWHFLATGHGYADRRICPGCGNEAFCRGKTRKKQRCLTCSILGDGVKEAEAALVEVRIPAKVYDECFDPMATGVPRESGWPTPTCHRIGKGHQFRYQVSAETAADMLTWATEFGEAQSFGVDDPSVGRIVLEWTRRERSRLSL